MLAVTLVLVITAVGLVRGLAGLELLERLALGSVLVLVLAIGATFAGKDASQLLGGGLPPVPRPRLVSVLLVLGGIVITVQGFETVRYLQHVDRQARIAGCRLSQLISSLVYIQLNEPGSWRRQIDSAMAAADNRGARGKSNPRHTISSLQRAAFAEHGAGSPRTMCRKPASTALMITSRVVLAPVENPQVDRAVSRDRAQ